MIIHYVFIIILNIHGTFFNAFLLAHFFVVVAKYTIKKTYNFYPAKQECLANRFLYSLVLFISLELV